MAGLFVLFLIICGICADAANAQSASCNPEVAWRKVRSSYPLHAQTIAACEARSTGTHVIVLTEPPHHIVRSNAEAILKSLFASKVRGVSVFRHPLGFDGWVDDAVITVEAQGTGGTAALADDLALLAQLTFGSTYKADVEDIDRLSPPEFWQAPPAIEIKAEETYAWLLGPSAESFIADSGGAPMKLGGHALRAGVYYSATPGLVVAALRNAGGNTLNNETETLRRFAVDTDAFLGAVKSTSGYVLLVGRERTTSLSAMPPLRLETILLLASVRGVQLAQSYERSRPFAGKLLINAGHLFGWDWAPILLSDELNDTHLGSLLNFTDNMLKGWSEGGRIAYKGFPHASPSRFPFSSAGAMRTIGGNRLTYNWNTAGVGYVMRIDDADVFAVRNTGSLPVSYFPEGTENDAAQKAKLVRAEDDAYRYFSSLRSPMLSQAVQYAALYQVFRAFGITARQPHDAAERASHFENVERVLIGHTASALNELAARSTPPNKHHLLAQAYMQLGEEGRSWQHAVPAGFRASVADFEQDVQRRHQALGEQLRSVGSLQGSYDELANTLVTGERSRRSLLPAGDLSRLGEEIKMSGLPSVRPLDDVRKAIVASAQRRPQSWIRTPSIVVSRGEERNRTGGHNIGGQATRVVVDPLVPKGSVSVGGSYVRGREIRVHPDDAAQSRDLVRLFDREVGLHDGNIAAGKTALEARLAAPRPSPTPIRPMTAALESSGRLSPIRGAEPSPYRRPIGEWPTRPSDRQATAMAQSAQSDGTHVLISRSPDGGYRLVRTAPPPPVHLVANSTISLVKVLPRELKLAAAGPPRVPIAKMVVEGMEHPEIARVIQALETRQKAVAGAGGKPPFGGDRGPLGFADAPEPGRPWGEGQQLRKVEDGFATKAWDGIAGVFGKRPTRVHVVDGKPELLRLTPQWSEAKVRVLDPDTVMLFNAPQYPGRAHIVEVRVPVTLEKPTTMLMWAKSWFKMKLDAAQSQALTRDVDAALKATPLKPTLLDAEAAAARVKELLKDTYKADDTWIHLRLESGDTVTVVELQRATRQPHG